MDAPLFVFDVESIGLHGEAFAVGGVLCRGGDEIDSFCFSCPPSNAMGARSDYEWVIANVPPITTTHDTPAGVRRAFWERLQGAMQAYSEVVVAAECSWPVEARFLCTCIDDDAETNRWLGPYPLHDVATVLLASGLDPLATRERLPNEMPAHNPLHDARQSARLWREAIQ